MSFSSSENECFSHDEQVEFGEFSSTEYDSLESKFIRVNNPIVSNQAMSVFQEEENTHVHFEEATSFPRPLLPLR